MHSFNFFLIFSFTLMTIMQLTPVHRDMKERRNDENSDLLLASFIHYLADRLQFIKHADSFEDSINSVY